MNNPCSETSSSASTSKPFDGRSPHRHTNRICVENVLNTPHASTDRVRTTSPPQACKFSCPPPQPPGTGKGAPPSGQRSATEGAKGRSPAGKGTPPQRQGSAPKRLIQTAPGRARTSPWRKKRAKKRVKKPIKKLLCSPGTWKNITFTAHNPNSQTFLTQKSWQIEDN